MKSRISLILLGAIVLTLGVIPAYAQEPGDTFVHLFEWKWTDIAEECEQFLGPNGYKAIQISPPQESPIIHEPPNPWWSRYQPVSYQLESRSGNRAEFAEMVSRCNAAGVEIYADAVINHMTGVYGQDNVPGGPPWHGIAGTPFGDYTYPYPDGSLYSYDDFYHCDLTPNDDISNYNSREQVQTCELVNLADLKSSDPAVQQKIADYLNDLLSLGVTGFRFDASKHMAASDLNAIVALLNNTVEGREPYIFQEVIGDNDEPVRDYEYYDSGRTTPDGYQSYDNGDVTEFKFGNRLSRLLEHGNLADLNGFTGEMMPGEYAVTFVDNHDTQRGSEVLTYKDGELYTLANIITLAWPYGYPKVMSSYFFTDREAGPPSDADLKTAAIYTDGAPDFSGWVTEHRWTPVANMVQFRKTAGAEPLANWWSNGSNQIAFGRGAKGFVVVNKEISPLLETLQTGLAEGKYCNVIDGALTDDGNNCTGSSVTVAADGTATFSVMPKSAAAIHVDAKTNPGTPAATISTTFVLSFTPEAGQSAYLVGSPAELGAWDLADAVALSDGGDGVWSATVELPANSTIEYKYTTGADAASSSFEGGENRVFITPQTGTESRLDTWRIPPVPVTFSVDMSANPPADGEVVFVSGSAEELGAWEQVSAVALTDQGSNIWIATVELPYSADVAYKYLKGADAASAVYEGGNNRTLTTPASGTVTQDDVWNAGSVNPYNADVFVRGSMNGWGVSDMMELEGGVFSTILEMTAADYQFKMASEDWATANFGVAEGDDPAIALGTPKTLGTTNTNINLTIPEDGRYEFVMDPADPEAPVATVRQVMTENPYGADIFVRGSMNGWGVGNPMTLKDGIFTAVLQLEAGTHEFKIASEDWSTADFGAGEDGQGVNFDTRKPLVRSGANLQLDIAQAGRYQFTVDAYDPENPILLVKDAPVENVVIHYRRTAGDYDGWGLHLWNEDPAALDASVLEGVEWDAPYPFEGEDSFGRFAVMKLADAAGSFGFIIHKGDEKDHGGQNMAMAPAADGLEIWMIQGSAEKYASEAEALEAAIGEMPELFVRGSMNEWGTGNQMKLDNTTYSAVMSLNAGSYQFKIADADWADANYGSGEDDVVELDVPETLAPGGGNLNLAIPSDGLYEFVVDLSDKEAPVITVKEALVMVIHYHRKNADYEGWGMHLWNFGDPDALDATVLEGVAWDAPYPFENEDDFGRYAVLKLADANGQFGFIIHKGDEKDHGGVDMTHVPAAEGFEIWMVEGQTEKFTSKADAVIAAGAVGNLNEAKARWISRDSLAWDVDAASGTPYLYVDPDGVLALSEGEIVTGENGQEIPLRFTGTIGAGTANDQKLTYLTYLSDWARIDTSGLDIESLISGAMAIGLKNEAGQLVDATSIQTAGLLDDLYANDEELGVIFQGDAPTLKLWAPTAKSVKLHLFDAPSGGTATVVEMSKDPATGVWSAAGDASWKNRFYLYEVDVFEFWQGEIVKNMVTDPYSVSLAMNSARSQIVDLNDAALKPAGWDGLQKPELDAPEDIVLYELHTRDFSISDETVPEALRGTFKAFTEADSNGVKHLSALADAGLTHLHLLPVFDIATINEHAAERIEITDSIDELCAQPGVAEELGSICADNAGRVIRDVMAEAAAADPASTVPQAIAMALRPFDGFNWGYDPFHYGVPEGSYATNPDGTTRIVEFREMVKALNDMGLRVVMDVVYNHTNAARDHQKSVLDKIVPGYYYRLDDGGNIQNSTCCPDTATEHTMMEKLMLDTLKRWAVQYKVDGFRFDLMGHHTRNNLKNVRAMMDELTVASDGVDGADIYLYGEGWKFGSIQINLPSTDDPNDIDEYAAFTQTNSAGAGVGSFNDRVRDMVRGAGFMKAPCLQGFVSGMEFDPNGLEECTLEDVAYSLNNYADNIRIAMAGNLKDYTFTGNQGSTVRGQDVAYFGGTPAGYTSDPQEVINYAEAHDNRPFWDYVQSQAPFDTEGRVPPKATLAERVRMQNLGMSLVALGQGVPFFHAGMDMLRSKSGDEDSYDYGDWFNKLDFSYESNNWGVGLPNADKNEGEWEFFAPRLRDASITPGKDDIMKAVNHFRELLQIRSSSKLFRLETADQIQERVSFLNAEAGQNQIPGVIVAKLSDEVGENLDPERKLLVVAVNVDKEVVQFSHESLVGLDLQLHPVQQNSADVVVKQSAFDPANGTLTIPARTAAVFEVKGGGSGPGPEPTPAVTPTPSVTPDPSAVPEPGTSVLLGLGLLGLLGAVRRKRR